MLILIAGITGMVGQPLAEYAISKGHRVRGLGRNPAKLPATIRDNLEGFVTSTGIYDIPALDRAVSGVDAVICAYNFDPEIVVEGQLFLLRAAERAGIFHAASWNYDWTLGHLGQHETYDSYIAFAAQARISSRIKPLYMFTGVIAEWLFSNRRDNIWDRDTKTMSYFGDGTEEWIGTTAGDLAAYTVEAVSAPSAEQGGFLRVESFRFTPAQLVAAYEEARGGKVKGHLKCHGSLDDVVSMLAKARAATDPIDHENYIGLAYVEHTLKGTWNYEPVDNKRFPTVKPTSLRQFFEAHPEL
ncbi:hypothetical protein J7T55_006590 [Diaporthe amygdali]|uniref:uncharacterized protein n=1 Tax=Phomopsis amygdali TaxID=1214568 RepID=UPI0022FF13DD|nr:uncharacterized protein J7T55_006590 [Diaporthe amygdali]KAJ0125245.1 hypothetical protein J7T55_006590 [Diaporthe amygdali]